MKYDSIKVRKNKVTSFDFFLFFGLFFFIVPIQINFGGVVLKTAIVSMFLITIFSLGLILKIGVVYKLNLYLYSYLLLLLCTAAIQFSIGGYLDPSLIKDVIVAILISITSWFFVEAIVKRKGEASAVYLLNIITYIVSLNSIVMIVVFMSDDFAELLYGFIEIDPKYHLNMQHGMRNPGLYYTGFSILSVVYSMLFIVKLVVVSEVQKKVNFLDVVVLFLLVVGVFYSGRAGFIILLLGVAIYVSSVFFRSNKSPLRRAFKMLFGFMVFASVFLFFLYYFGYSYYLEWFFEAFINLSEGSVLESRSTNALFESHYFLPKDEVSQLFGIGNFGRVEVVPYIPSDVGYILFIHGVGVIGTVIFFSFFLYALYVVFVLRVPFYIKFIFFYIVFSILLASFKDFYFLSHLTYGQLFFLVYYLAISEHRRVLFKKRLASE